MIADSVRYLKGRPDRLLRRGALLRRLRRRPRLRAAVPGDRGAGRRRLRVLCDTNGGTITSQLAGSLRARRGAVPCAGWGSTYTMTRTLRSQNTLAAVEAGCDAGAGLHQRLGRHVRERQPPLGHRQPQAQDRAGRDRADEQLARLTDVARIRRGVREPAPNPRPAVRGCERVRRTKRVSTPPPGIEGRMDIPACRPVAGRQLRIASWSQSYRAVGTSFANCTTGGIESRSTSRAAILETTLRRKRRSGYAVRRRGGDLRIARSAHAGRRQAALRDNEPQGDGGARPGGSTRVRASASTSPACA